MRTLFYALVPLFLLFTVIAISCVLAFIVLKLFGDILPLQKLVSKFTELLLIASIFPIMKRLQLNRYDLGFAKRSIFIKQLGLGLLLGLLTLLPIFYALWLLELHQFNHDKVWTVAAIISKLGLALIMAILVSLLEEPIFRGILITGLSKKMSSIWAIIVSAFYYACLHFLDNNVDIAAQDVHFFTAFQLLGGAIANVFNPVFLSSLYSLIAVGIFLGMIRKTIPNSLGICIGCHAAWVWQIKAYKLLFSINLVPKYLYLIGNYDGIIGHLVTGWLLLEIVKYSFYRWLTANSEHKN